MRPLVEAEQAVLGAVLLDPGQLPRLAGWLAPAHFSRPVHAALYAAMLKLRADRHPAAHAGADEVPLSWVTDTVAEASRHVRGLTAAYPHTLAAACPRPGHAPAYGRMVLEGAIHRSVAEHAVRLHQAARADAVRGEAEESLHCARRLTGVLTDLGRRWGGVEPRATALRGPSPAAPQPSLPSDERVVADERHLLGVLVERPARLDQVVAWLRPEDFAVPAHALLYRCVAALHHRGEPVDHLTVLWEAQHRGLLADGTVTAEQVRDICGSAAAGSAEYLAQQVARASVLRTAATSARAVQELADDESLSPGRLIGYALHALEPLAEAVRRWRQATGSPEPPVAARPFPDRIVAARTRSRLSPPNRAVRPPAAAARTVTHACPSHRSRP
ncbi:helicase DnaB [Streptomyces sp. S1A]|uniref:DnaB-like helicase N-terminal domain-containing protein n=1 Tax=Streptomyces sp. ICN903 TaxID=2964654 RepID=UPI001EDC89D9|nr:DnaB-like helicase N-terminal domain-containing protein [Streptomyces sp. ICN903]MCG3039020.1 helicase DnaB [Streptomyces sp. ICN903]